MADDKIRIFAECIDAIEEGRMTAADCLAWYPQYQAELADLLGIASEVWAMPVVRPTQVARQQSKAHLLAQLPPRTLPLPARQIQQRWPVFSYRGALAAVGVLTFFLLLLGSGVFTAVGASVVRTLRQQGEVAQIVSIEATHGTVELLGADGKWTPVSKQIAVTTDYRLRTGDDSRVRIAFPDGRVASLGPNNEVFLSDLFNNTEAFGGVITGTVTMTPTPTETPFPTTTATLVPTPTGSVVTICHRPGTPAEKTLTLPVAALNGHLGHGDTLGACMGPTPTMTSTITVTPTITATVTVTPTITATQTITATPVPTITTTPMPTIIPTTTVMPTDVPGSSVTICHQPGTPAQQTLTVPEAALDGHLGHGDTIGNCPQSTSAPPQPPPNPAPPQPPPPGNGNGGGNGGNGNGNGNGNGGGNGN